MKCRIVSQNSDREYEMLMFFNTFYILEMSINDLILMALELLI